MFFPRSGIESILPPDAHELAQHRLHVSITNTRTRENLLVSSFSSREDLIQVTHFLLEGEGRRPRQYFSRARSTGPFFRRRVCCRACSAACSLNGVGGERTHPPPAAHGCRGPCTSSAFLSRCSAASCVFREAGHLCSVEAIRRSLTLMQLIVKFK